MNWSIDAEWYDADEHLPPVDEEVLCVVKSSGSVWNEATQSFKREPMLLRYLGSHDQYGWYMDGEYRPSADVLYWTWLPKVPSVWRIEHEEND